MKRIADLARKYLARHADPYNRLLHLIGVPVVFYGIGIAFTGKYALSVSFIAVGYFFQYVGHRIEGNRMGEVELIVRISRKVRA